MRHLPSQALFPAADVNDFCPIKPLFISDCSIAQIKVNDRVLKCFLYASNAPDWILLS